MQHMKIFGIRIIVRKGEIEIGIERDDFAAEHLQYLWREGSGGAIAARGNDFQLAPELRPVGEVGNIARRVILDEAIRAAIRKAEFSL